MCGLAGVAGNLYTKDCDAFTDLLYMTGLRGEDSTGIAVVNSTADTKLFKAPMAVSHFINTKGFDHLVVPSSRVIMGHCRKATQGKVNYENAHPFEFKHLVGCHNGTLTYQSKNDLPDSSKFDTDSETLFNSFQVRGPKTTIESIEGAWALVWYNKVEKTLNFLRNSERPLVYAFDDTEEKIFWASEVTMLHAALIRNGIKYKTAYYVPDNKLMSWKIPKFSDKFEDATYTKMEGKKRTVFTAKVVEETNPGGMVYSPPGDWTPSKNTGYWCTRRCKYIPFFDAEKEYKEANKKEEEPEVISLPVTFKHSSTCTCTTCEEDRKVFDGTVPIKTAKHLTYIDEKGHKLTKKQFDLIAHNGCLWCGDNISWQDPCVFHDGSIYCLEHFDSPEDISEILKNGGRIVR